MFVSKPSLTVFALILAACGRGPEDRTADRPFARAAVAEPLAAAKPPAVAAANAPSPAASCDAPGRECAACDGKADPPAAAERTRETIELGDAPVLGRRDAPVTIVIFSDFECPFCAKVEPRVSALFERYRGEVRLVFKNQPLPMHERATLAAKAALAADEQGKFWEYHRALFAKRALDRDSLEALARELGLNVSRFRAAIDGDGVERRIGADLLEAQRLGVKGTPTFFVNGRRIIGAQPNEVFVAAIDEELALAKAR